MNLARYRDLFVSEAREHLKVFNSLAVSCESGNTLPETINEMFRRAHSMKGMAATMQFTPVNSLTHAIEDLLGRLRSGELTFSRQVTDLLLAGSDTLEQAVDLIAKGSEPPFYDELAARIRNYNPDLMPELPVNAQESITTESGNFIFRISDNSSTIKVRTALLDRLVTLSGELLTVKHQLENEAKVTDSSRLSEPLRALSRLLKQLQNEVLHARMLPFAVISERFPRMVRDLAGKSGKEILFRIQGEDIELDRGVLELIAEPLLHLLRNAVDHGLETPSERVATGKSPEGSLRLSINRLSDHLTIVLEDDGRGMDPARIRAKALSQGIIDDLQAKTITDSETLMLVCTAGFSTLTTVTEISGRGVGMDVVKTAIQSIGGILQINSTLGSGTSISLRIPVSTAIIQALIAECGDLDLAIPVASITKTQEINTDSIFFRDRQPFLYQNNNELELRSLRRFYRQPDNDYDSSRVVQILITETNGRSVGLIVDRVICQQEIFVRPLSEPLSSLRGISGATLMGDGRIIFVTDTAACVRNKRLSA